MRVEPESPGLEGKRHPRRAGVEGRVPVWFAIEGKMAPGKDKDQQGGMLCPLLVLLDQRGE